MVVCCEKHSKRLDTLWGQKVKPGITLVQRLEYKCAICKYTDNITEFDEVVEK